MVVCVLHFLLTVLQDRARNVIVRAMLAVSAAAAGRWRDVDDDTERRVFVCGRDVKGDDAHATTCKEERVCV